MYLISSYNSVYIILNDYLYQLVVSSFWIADLPGELVKGEWNPPWFQRRFSVKFYSVDGLELTYFNNELQ